MPAVNFFHEIISGYDISCYGGTAGVSTSISGGSPPYTYKWYNSANVQIATSKDLISAPAGVYTLYLYKNGNSSSWNVTLTEPNAINITLFPSLYTGGFNISQSGGSDGTIDCIVQGGVPSYYYQWSNSSDWESISNLNAGTYSVTVTDENGCTGTSSVTLTAPANPLHIVSITSPLHHTFNVSCNGGNDGVIDLTVSGGVPPYSYNWGGTYTEDRSGLIAGTYTVIVDDNIPGGQDTAHITLTQPEMLTVGLTSPIFPNGFNTSCYNCKDGKINTAVSGGVNPFLYSWNNGKTTSSLDSLVKGIDTVTVTDNNGCILKQSIEITSDIEGWKIGGNLNIDTSLQFMGTKDNKDLILKTNNIKRMTIKSDGKIEMNSPLKIFHASDTSTSNYRAVYAHSDGTIDFVGTDGTEEVFTDPCLSYLANPWFYKKSSCVSHNSNDIFLNYNFRNIGIGTTQPSTKLDIIGGIRSSDLSGTVGFNIVHTGFDGKLTTLSQHSPLNTSNQYVLNGNGTWGLSSWLTNGTNIYSNPSTNNVGIGTSFPSEALQIGDRFTIHNGGNKVIGYNFSYNGTNNIRLVQDFSSAIYFDSNGQISFKTAISDIPNSTISWIDAITIKNDGKVGIGSFTTNNWDGTYKLYVKEGIRTEKIKVDISSSSGWADYVFKKDYKLRSLESLEYFINENGHLPNIPSSDDVMKNGIDLAEMQSKLLEKIEELSLYILQIKKENDLLKNKVDKLCK